MKKRRKSAIISAVNSGNSKVPIKRYQNEGKRKDKSMMISRKKVCVDDYVESD
jgi:hypothetical protein